MNYVQIAKEVQTLSYTDKLALAQLLIQLARKEEEEKAPAKRAPGVTPTPFTPDLLDYAAAILRKQKPGTVKKLMNSLDAMHQFKGGISDSDKEALVRRLHAQGFLTVTANDRVVYQRAEAA